MTAGEFGRRARAAESDIDGRGKRALFVGGSGLYLRAALGGLDDALPEDPEVRAAIQERLRSEGSESLHGELTELDPESADQIAVGDAHRITRALEIIQISGRKASEGTEQGENRGARCDHRGS